MMPAPTMQITVSAEDYGAGVEYFAQGSYTKHTNAVLATGVGRTPADAIRNARARMDHSMGPIYVTDSDMALTSDEAGEPVYTQDVNGGWMRVD
jgi:hypothetical protein